MEEAFLMRSTMFDIVKLSSDKLQYDLFVDDDDVMGDRFTSVIESNIVRWFFYNEQRLTQYLFYEELGIGENYKLFLEVQKPIIKDSGLPGDIDILLVDVVNPHLSIAFEVKKTKVIIDPDDRVILKTSKVKHGILQCKHMYNKYRFHKTFLMLLLVTDGANRGYNQQMFRYPSYAEKKSVYFHSGFGDLPEDVGIFIIEINQPSRNSIDFTGQISSKMLKSAKSNDQLNETTESIIAFLRK